MRRIFFLIPIFLVGAVTAAQEGAVLTEEEFLSVFDAEHPAAVSLTGELGIAEAERRQAGLLRNPSLGIIWEQPDDVPRETTWIVSWTPPLDGRRRWSVSAAEARVEAERNSFESDLAGLRLELRGSFAQWVDGHWRVSILGEHADRLEALARRMQHRAESGEESPLNARRLEIASDNSRAALVEARAQAVVAQAKAATWLSPVASDSSSALSSLVPELPELPEVPEGLDLAQRPDLQAVRWRVEQAEAVDRLSRRFVAAPEIVLGWKTIELSIDQFDGPVFGFNWAVPILDRRQGDRLAAQTSVAAARARSEWLIREAQGELAATRAAYDELRQSAISAQEALGGLDDVALAATAAFDQGESSLTDLLDSLKAVLDARLTALDLYMAALEAHRELELVTGQFLTHGGVS